MISKDENSKRLKVILNGPWVEKGKLAEDFMISNFANNKFPKTRRIYSNYNNDSKPYIFLKKALRPFKSDYSDKESIFRDSLDEALATLQILELAFQTHYLNQDLSEEVSRKKLICLLTPSAVREYLMNYDFYGVRFLAKRFNIETGLPSLSPPPDFKLGDIRFEMFLTTNLEFYKNENIDLFLGFLDGYLSYKNEQNIFYNSLRNHNLNKKHYQRLKNGLDEFVLTLHQFFSILEENEKLYYGLYFSYWLMKFFGFDLEKNNKFIKLDRILYDWGNEYLEVLRSPTYTEEKDLYNQKLKMSIKDIYELWLKVKDFIEESHNA